MAHKLYFCPPALPGFAPIFITQEYVGHLIQRLSSEDTRQFATAELLRIRFIVPDLAEMLWYSFATFSGLLQEIVDHYLFVLTPPSLTMMQFFRVESILSLLEIVAIGQQTRLHFAKAKLLDMLNPFLITTANTMPIENLRHASVKLVYAVAKYGGIDALTILLQTDVLAMAFTVMGYEVSSFHSQMQSISIMQTILLQETGLNYFCSTCSNFTKVATPLANLVVVMEKRFNPVLARKIIECYLLLAKNRKGLQGLRFHIPTQISNGSSLFSRLLGLDFTAGAMRWQLMEGINAKPALFLRNYPEIYNARRYSRYHHTFNEQSDPTTITFRVRYGFYPATVVPITSQYNAPNVLSPSFIEEVPDVPSGFDDTKIEDN